MLGVIFGRDTQERRPPNSGLPLLVKWRQRLPLWSRPDVPNSGQCVHDHIFSEPVHLFYVALMPDFQPTSEVI
jgi:hypothetical protein